MLERRAHGALPAKHHAALRTADGGLRYEECLTREGFDGPYTILYHQHRPQALTATEVPLALTPPAQASGPHGLSRRHLMTSRLRPFGSVATAQVALLHNADLTLSVTKPSESDTVYSVNADGDELLFIREGRGMLRSTLGDLAYDALDYVFIPKGVLHRFEVADGVAHDYLRIECRRGREEHRCRGRKREAR